jgi:glucose-6-phosphate-specific signal transduction histidine kinase
MSNSRYSQFFLAVTLLFAGAGGGCALAYKLAGAVAASSFMKFCIVAVLMLSFTQLRLTFLGRRRATYQVLSHVVFAVSIVWFLGCLLLPLFWIPSISMLAKTSMFLVGLFLFAANLLKGVEIFERKWHQVGGELLRCYYNGKANEIGWQKIIQSLKMSVRIYIPGVPERFAPIISVFILTSMFGGLSLRNAFPASSALAWSLSIIVVVSLFVQMIGLAIGQFLQLRSLEKSTNTKIRPV